MKKKILTISLITIFSILLWIFVSLSSDYFASVDAKIKFTNIPDGYLVTNVSSEQISFSLKGQGWLLAQITFGRNPVFEIDVNNKVGEQSILIRNYISKNSWLTSSLEITEITPSLLTFEVEKKYSKVVPINPVIKLAPKEGFGLVTNIEMMPDSVKLVGTEEDLSKIKFAETIYAEFLDVDSPIESELQLKNIKNVQFIPASTKIRIDVQKIVDKTVNNILVNTLNVPRGRTLELIPSMVQVVVRGGLKQLAKIESKDFSAYVDFKEAIADTLGVIQPHIKAPEYIEVLSIKPNKLKYYIKNY